VCERTSLNATLAGAVAMIALSALPVLAQSNDFYRGKTITFLINFTPGGPTDFEARLVARHIVKYIPGAPTIVPRNMPGGAGIIGLNWLGQVAPRDGTTVGFFTGAASKSAMGDPGIKVDITKMGFLASGPGTSVAYIRKDVAPGINKPEDILKAKDFWAGGLSPEADKDVRIRMQLDLLNIPYKYISGFRGSAEARLALQRGEVNMTAESMPTYRASIEPNIINTGEGIPLWYDPYDDGKEFTTPPEAANIPAEHFPAFYKRVKGEYPKGEMWEAFRVVNNVGTLFLRTLHLPQDSPPEAMAALKDGLAKMQEDAEFKAEAIKTMQYVPKYVTDKNTEEIFKQTMNPPAQIRAFLREYIEKGQKDNGRR
jgi:tripartite-type tricarboxylate transporter receptor subunit TctC